MLFDVSTTYIWFGLAVLFTVAELATTTLVSIWFVAGAVGALLVSLVFDSLGLELVVFIVVSGAMLFYTRPIVAKKLLKSTPTNADMLIGKTALVVEAIAPGQPGRVSIEGLTWLAKSDKPLLVGQPCTILKIEGAALICDKQTAAVSL